MTMSPLEKLITKAWKNGCDNIGEDHMKSMSAEQLFIDMHGKDSFINEYTEEVARNVIAEFHRNGYKF